MQSLTFSLFVCSSFLIYLFLLFRLAAHSHYASSQMMPQVLCATCAYINTFTNTTNITDITILHLHREFSLSRPLSLSLSLSTFAPYLSLARSFIPWLRLTLHTLQSYEFCAGSRFIHSFAFHAERSI